MGQGKGVVASFWLVSENSGSWSFLQLVPVNQGVIASFLQGVGASFRLVPVNQGVVASFWLVLENSGSWCFLQVGACKSGGWCLLPVGAGEFGSWCFL
jgi:hypothetical protein